MRHKYKPAFILATRRIWESRQRDVIANRVLSLATRFGAEIPLIQANDSESVCATTSTVIHRSILSN